MYSSAALFSGVNRRPATRQTSAQAHFNGARERKFPNPAQAEAQFYENLKQAHVTTQQLWKDWGVWYMTFSYNQLNVRYDPTQKPELNEKELIGWLSQFKPPQQGNQNDASWVYLIKTPIDPRKNNRGCCGVCGRCLNTNPGLLNQPPHAFQPQTARNHLPGVIISPYSLDENA